MIPREVNVPGYRMFVPTDYSYAEAVQKAIDGWFVLIGFVPENIEDESLYSFVQDAYDIIVYCINPEMASDLEIVVEPAASPAGKRLFLTRKGNCTYRLAGVGEDGLEYERV